MRVQDVEEIVDEGRLWGPMPLTGLEVLCLFIFDARRFLFDASLPEVRAYRCESGRLPVSARQGPATS